MHGNPDANPPVPDVGAIQTTSETFQINNAKLYRPVATLSIDDNIKFLEIIKQVYKRTISWNKFRYEITTQTKSNNLDYLFDPTFRNINKMFFHSKMVAMVLRETLDKYYMPLVEIKDFNALIDNKPFFDQPVKNKHEAYGKLIEMTRNDDYTTGKLLDSSYHQKQYKLIDIDLSRIVRII